MTTELRLVREPRDWGVQLVDQFGTVLTLDVVVSESPTDDAEVPDHPLEDGTPISEHYRVKPVEVTIVAQQSDTPIWIEPTEVNRAANAYETLRGFMDRAEILTVTTGLRVYEQMVLASIAPRTDLETGQAIEFTLVLRQVKFVAPVFMRIPEEWIDADVDGTAEADRGNTNGTEAEEQDTSVLNDLINVVTGGGGE